MLEPALREARSSVVAVERVPALRLAARLEPYIRQGAEVKFVWLTIVALT